MATLVRSHRRYFSRMAGDLPRKPSPVVFVSPRVSSEQGRGPLETLPCSNAGADYVGLGKISLGYTQALCPAGVQHFYTGLRENVMTTC